MPQLIVLSLLSAALASPPACPTDGRIEFHRSGDGYRALTALGDDSYWTLFVGERLETRAGAKGRAADPATFSVDGVKLAWELVPNGAFGSAPSASARDRLSSFYRYQTRALRDLANKGKLELADLQVYDLREEEGRDGATHPFRIWKAVLDRSGAGRGQYGVATSHPSGVVLLSVSVRGPEDEAKAKVLIDSYMSTFGLVSRTLCEKFHAAEKAERAATGR